ncbi:MAG: bifunctional diguanylate cyclase/phosphodiesterase [Piscinibacter sp.]|nr:bifunctional diguanylate cyclase/phosphodiesterase [Piscinibacter sp.]
MSGPAWIDWALRAELLAGAGALGVLAAFTALTLIRELAGADAGARWRRLVSASLAVALGAVAAQVLLLSGETLPTTAGYEGGLLLAACALLVACTLVAKTLVAGARRSVPRLAGAALVFGAGLCAAGVLGVDAFIDGPALTWNTLGLVGAWALGSLGVGTALVIGAARPGGSGHGKAQPAGSRIAPHRTIVAALAMGATLLATDVAVLVSARVPAGPGTLVGTHPGSDGLVLLSVLGAPAVLFVLLFSTFVEDRFRDLLARARDELRRATFTDPLTLLPNRLLFEEGLQRAVHRADRSRERLALLFFNLDGLKGVNETQGQGTGDAVLRTVGERLRAFCGPTLLARAGGDEFLILFDDDPEPTVVARRAAALLDEIARPCAWQGGEVQVTASIGIAMYPEHGALSRLIPHASAALQAAKRMGGATYCFFEAQMTAGRRDETDLLRDLRGAIEAEALELVYQPKIHAPSGQITGAEALMRWHHPRRGMVSPLVFIPLAEHYGLINTLGNWAIDEACRQIRVWRNQGLRMRVAINLSMHQLRQADLATRIGAALARNRLEPSVLTCEITESIAMDDSPATAEVIRQLAGIGVHLSIDDFGTGYSNFGWLSKLPLEEIKIDRGLVLDLEAGGRTRKIVDAVVKLAQALELKVVAEGVETEQQQEILRELGCDELQGFLFAKPMSARALAHWAMNHEGPRALDFRASLFGETRQVELT